MELCLSKTWQFQHLCSNTSKTSTLIVTQQIYCKVRSFQQLLYLSTKLWKEWGTCLKCNILWLNKKLPSSALILTEFFRERSATSLRRPPMQTAVWILEIYSTKRQIGRILRTRVRVTWQLTNSYKIVRHTSNENLCDESSIITRIKKQIVTVMLWLWYRPQQ